MQLSDELKTKTAAELEEWFIESLEAEDLPLDDLLAVLAGFAAAGETGRCQEWAELLQEALAERGDTAGMLLLLRHCCSWREDTAEFRDACAQAAGRVLTDRHGQAFLKNAGFDRGLSGSESVRRLTLLTHLTEGAFCHDKTWGFGVVRRLDDFYEKVTIDFTKKTGHQMSFAYAAETLEVVDEDHLGACLHSRPEELANLVKTRPDEVVRMALRSYGPLSAQDLQDRMVPDIVSEADWKPFWDAARKRLKADPLFDLPGRRSEPMRLLESKKEYDDRWFADLANERDPEKILKRIRELKDSELPESGSQQSGIMAERCSFALKAFRGQRPDLTARVLLAIERLDLPCEGEGSVNGVRRAWEGLLDSRVFRKAATDLPAKELQRLLLYLDAREPDRAGETFVATLSVLPVWSLDPVTDFLEASRHKAAMVECLQNELRERVPAVSLLAWAARHIEKVESWSLVDMFSLIGNIVDILGVSMSGEELKARKVLLGKLGQSQWMKRVLAALDDRQRQALAARIRLARGWDEAERRSLMARCIKLYPELEATVADRSQEPDERSIGRMTSWRSYRERQEAFRKLLEVTIPENSREIGVALSYGDLRENFEYQAAKDRQRLLLQRKTEIERDLAEVKGTDFSGMAADLAGMGTCVAVKKADGGTDRYCILGEWDRDETLNIISSSSKLAQVLEGGQPGDEVLLPGADTETRGTIVEVTALTDDIRKWMAGG